MFKCGLVSISFRSEDAEKIIKAASRAALDVIEWGSDVHLPPDDLAVREHVVARSREAGISTPTYGSYFRIGVTPREQFPALCEVAEALGASTVRVWGGSRAITPNDGEEWAAFVTETRAVAEMASERGISVALECHIGTVTESYGAALALLREVGSESLRLYWQPNQYKTHEENIEAARALAPYVDCIHVFNWHRRERLPLSDGEAQWREYLGVFKPEAQVRDIPVLLEFMPDGKIESLAKEAAALRKIAGSLA